MLYIFFFIYALKVGTSIWTALVPILIGSAVVLWTEHHFIGLGMICFFAGGITFMFYKKYRLISVRGGKLYIPAFILCMLSLISLKYAGELNIYVETVVMYGVFFPSLILLLASLQDLNHNFGNRYRMIGDITYSTYLLHFPLQLIIITSTTYWNIQINYYQPGILILFFAILILVSIFTYHYIEMPS